jgi:glucose-1-phosphate adenylyltransferase
LISPGAIVSGSTVRRSILSPGAFVHTGALVEDSVLLDGVEIGRGAVVRSAILDKNVVVAPGARIGVDGEGDRRRFQTSPKGVVAIAKGQVVPVAGT